MHYQSIFCSIAITSQVTLSNTSNPDGRDPAYNSVELDPPGNHDRASKEYFYGVALPVIRAGLSWPEVVNAGPRTFGGRPRTIVSWRIDQHPAATSSRLIDTAEVTASMFDNQAHAKLIGKRWGAKQLVVQRSRSTPQSAKVDFADIQTAAARLGAICGIAEALKK